MNVNIFKLDGDYKCSAYSDKEFSLEEACNQVMEEELHDLLCKEVPRMANEDIRIKVAWVYEGFQVFVLGTKLTEEEIDSFVLALDPIKRIRLCSMFWEIRDKNTYTGILLNYDNKHYHRFMVDHESFIVLTYEGFDAFIEKLALDRNFHDPEMAMLLAKLKFAYDGKAEREIVRQKMRGVSFAAEVEINNKGKMHTSGFQQRDFTNFSGFKK